MIEEIRNVEFVIEKGKTAIMDGILLSGGQRSWIGEKSGKIRSELSELESRLRVTFNEQQTEHLCEFLLDAMDIKFSKRVYVTDCQEIRI